VAPRLSGDGRFLRRTPAAALLRDDSDQQEVPRAGRRVAALSSHRSPLPCRPPVVRETAVPVSLANGVMMALTHMLLICLTVAVALLVANPAPIDR
jgi:hypothetical protein